jgi:hypothetical protein
MTSTPKQGSERRNSNTPTPSRSGSVARKWPARSSIAIKVEEDEKKKQREIEESNLRAIKASKWIGFDLKQSSKCTGLDITIDRPLIVIKDRPYLDGELQFDLGNIHITSHTEMRTGRWLNLPE